MQASDVSTFYSIVYKTIKRELDESAVKVFFEHMHTYTLFKILFKIILKIIYHLQLLDAIGIYG